MCPLIIPYRFVGGTYAKAEEVNENFTQTKQFVDILETNISEHDLEIMQLNSNKASLNGSSNEIFRVADPVNDFDAVNKQTMLSNLWVSQETIRGLEITKASNTTVTVAAGGCYDSSDEYLLRSYESINTDDTVLNKNTTYYVYFIGNDIGNTSAVLSTNSGSPSLPVGYTLYRNIGFVTTDDNGYIATVNTGANEILQGKGVFPNFTNRVSRSAGTTYKANTNGWLWVRFYCVEHHQFCAISINGTNWDCSRHMTNREGGGWTTPQWVPIPKGATYWFGGTGNEPVLNFSAYWIPCL